MSFLQIFKNNAALNQQFEADIEAVKKLKETPKNQGLKALYMALFEKKNLVPQTK